MSIEYRRELISVLCEQLIPLLKEEEHEKDSAPWRDACHDLAFRLACTADWFRQTPTKTPNIK